jgi:hypothetical protein
MNPDTELARFKQSVTLILTGLGNTSHEIAASLTTLGVQGIPNNGHDDLLINLIRLLWNQPEPLPDLWTEGNQIVIGPLGHTLGTIPLPYPCQDFVADWDGGDYPHLIRTRRPVSVW